MDQLKLEKLGGPGRSRYGRGGDLVTLPEGGAILVFGQGNSDLTRRARVFSYERMLRAVVAGSGGRLSWSNRIRWRV